MECLSKNPSLSEDINFIMPWTVKTPLKSLIDGQPLLSSSIKHFHVDLLELLFAAKNSDSPPLAPTLLHRITLRG